MKDNVKTTLDAILSKFESGDIVEPVALAMFPGSHIPSAKWSLLNRAIMYCYTQDGRGFRQWQDSKRHVLKGAKCFHILAPCIKTGESAQGEQQQKLIGFRCQPIFRVEDTDGEPLEYEELILPELPLMDVALSWGISVSPIPGGSNYYGYYSPSRKVIKLATDEECVFFHELAHAAHDRVVGGLKQGQNPLQEIVAELTSVVLCRIVGRQPKDTMGCSYKYIERYSRELKLTAHQGCLKVLSETEKVLNLILGGDQPVAGGQGYV